MYNKRKKYMDNMKIFGVRKPFLSAVIFFTCCACLNFVILSSMSKCSSEPAQAYEIWWAKTVFQLVIQILLISGTGK